MRPGEVGQLLSTGKRSPLPAFPYHPSFRAGQRKHSRRKSFCRSERRRPGRSSPSQSCWPPDAPTCPHRSATVLGRASRLDEAARSLVELVSMVPSRIAAGTSVSSVISGILGNACNMSDLRALLTNPLPSPAGRVGEVARTSCQPTSFRGSNWSLADSRAARASSILPTEATARLAAPGGTSASRSGAVVIGVLSSNVRRNTGLPTRSQIPIFKSNLACNSDRAASSSDGYQTPSWTSPVTWKLASRGIGWVYRTELGGVAGFQCGMSLR
jgi:hypothetical protein